MEDVNISKYRAQVVRAGSTPASPGFVVSEGQNPVDPSGSGQNHLPVTIATAATGLSITESQVLGGAGTVGQYIRGDGSLADFPATTGGGSSVSYYLNGSVSQGTIGGVAYKELNRTPVFGTGTDISINADGYIASFITDALDPNKLLIPGGNWNFETYFSASSSGGSPSFYVELYKYDGTTFTLLATSSSAPELIAFGTNLNPYFSTLAVPETVLALTDRLAVRFYVTHSGRTITLHTEDNHLCQVITTFTTGLTALNGLTSQVQFFAVGTSGTDFAISSASDTHTFNLPTASATNRGALSSADWTTFNNKTSNLGTVTSVGLSSATSGVTIGSTPITTSGTITLAIATASGSQNGLLSSTDWTTFNGKQNALTNPVTGTGTSGTLPKFTGSTTIGNSLFTDNGTNGAFGGANYSSGTDVRSFNISAPLYAGLGFFTNNVISADIFSYSVTGNLLINADPTNVFSSTKIGFGVDGTERLAIFNNGNVSIGNSPTDNGAKLQVNGSVTTMATITSSGTASGLQLTNTGSTASSWIIQSDGGAVAGQAALRFYSLTASAYRMSIDASGNVGIGTITPPSRLSVQWDKSTAFSGLGVYDSQAYNASNHGGTVTFGGTFNSGGSYTEWSAIGGMKSNTTDGNVSGDINFYTRLDGSAMTERMRITSGGNIGIGVNPAVKFQINDGTNINLGIKVGQTDSSAVMLNAYNDAVTANIPLEFRASKFGFQNGNVLIGTTTDGGRKLEIQTGSTNAALWVQTGGTTSSYVIADFRTGTNLPALQILGNGLVDIGGPLVIRGTLPVDQTDAAVIDHFSNTMRIFSYGAAGVTGDFQFRTAAGGAGSNLVSTINGTTGAYTAVSDVNRKKDFEESTIGLDAILGLKPTLYRMKSETNTQKHLGFIAQEVRQYIPNAYVENGEFIGLNEMPIIAALTKAIQELKKEIDTLKN